MEVTLEVRVLLREEETLAITQEIATGDLDGAKFEVVQGVNNPLEWRIRAEGHTAMFDLSSLIEGIVRRM